MRCAGTTLKPMGELSHQALADAVERTASGAVRGEPPFRRAGDIRPAGPGRALLPDHAALPGRPHPAF